MSAVALVALVALAVAGEGCRRRPDILPPSADSSRAALPDSTVLRLREIGTQWETPGPDVAGLTARIVLDDLRAHLREEPRARWDERVRSLLDSVDVGSEIASGRCAMIVAFFARSNPSAGSWPYLYACGPKEIQMQPIEGQGMSLSSLVDRGLFGDTTGVPKGVAAIYARRTAAGRQPVLMVWVPAGASWKLAQTLGADSLGGVGSAEFRVAGDSIGLVARAYRGAAHFEECATCPHVFEEHRFAWGRSGFTRIGDRTLPSPYATFVNLIHALEAHDDDRAQALVIEPALLDVLKGYGWETPKGPWRAAPETDETDREMVFFHGAQEAYKVSFEPRSDGWVVAGVVQTTRNVE